MCIDGWLKALLSRGFVVVLLVLLVSAPLAGLVSARAPAGDGPAATAVTTDPLPVYHEVTDAAGLGDFLHAGYLGPGAGNGPIPFFTEFTGPGACWLDHDDDADLDLYLVNTRYQTDPEKNAIHDPHSKLYRNNGDGTFTDATVTANARTQGILQGCAGADYDNDGDTDLYVTGWNGSFLLRNDGGTFTDVTDVAGVRDDDCGEYRCWASSPAWFDADLDGCLDLFVPHFTEYDPKFPPEFNGPTDGQVNRFFRSDCDGTFSDHTAAAGLDDVKYDTWSAMSSDLNNDGWPDLYVSNDGDPNDVYINDGDGTFTRDANSEAADARSGMGTAIGDFDHSGRMDIVTTNFIRQHNGIFQAFGNGYLDIGGEDPFTDAYEQSGWSTNWFDMDRDGHLDLMVFNGNTEDYGHLPVREPQLAYRNLDGAGTFEAVRDRIGADFTPDFVGRGGAWADYDNDGDIDFLLAEAGEAPTHLFRADGVGNRFLTVDLSSNVPGVNRDAIGARVTVSAVGIEDQMQEKVAGNGFLSGSDPRLHFGLGNAAVATVEVDWPDGSSVTFTDVRANSFVRVTQGGPLEILNRLPLVTLDVPSDPVRRLSDAAFAAHVEPPAGRTIVGYEWDFGDGATATGGATAAHAYSDVGRFTVRVTVTDSAGDRATAWGTVNIWDVLQVDVDMTKDVFDVGERPTGVATVTFPDGTPVVGADVAVMIQRTTGDPGLDAQINRLPFFMHQFMGWVPIELDGTTDGNGQVGITVPYNVIQVTPLVPLNATHPGQYDVLAHSSARGSTAEPFETLYRVLVPEV